MSKEEFEIIKFSYGDIELDIKVSPKENTVWLSIEDMTILFKKSRTTISKHIKNILQSDNSDENSVSANFAQVHQKFAHTAQDGKTYLVDFYSLDVVMEVGNRMNSEIASIFYNWCMEVLGDLNGESEMKSNIVRYENGNVSLNVNYSPEEKTIWMTQNQIAKLYGTTKQNVSLHINNIFEDAELKADSVVKDYLTTAKDGKKYFVTFYNLDMILAVGYRTRTSRAIYFRNWATSILTEYLRDGYVSEKNNNRFITSEEHAGLVNRVFHLEMDMDQMKNDFSHLIVNEKVLYENTELDSLAFISQLVESAKESLILIDPFVSVRTLIPFKFKREGVSFLIIKSFKSRITNIEIEEYEKEYGEIIVTNYDDNHDRFLIIDKSVYYKFGGSIDYAGRTYSIVTKIKNTDSIASINKMIDKALESDRK